ncbi:MAG: prolyl oligopeptidase family serine peptidase [Prolixibacteraceae bacterium]|nr:prolyl oligopeptidase family serine peptidase [Prolixibacteraceae bacterium]
MKRRFFSILIVSVSLLFTSCGEDFPEITPVVLSSFTETVLTTPYTPDYVKQLLTTSGLNQQAERATYEVKIYTLKYKTNFNGKTIEASGLIAIPVPLENNEEFPIMSFQHGVLTRNEDAPTSNIYKTPVSELTYLASTGMIVVIPDYVGFGATSDTFHPFMMKDANVVTIIDMIKAAKEFVISEKFCKYNDNLFLVGHSEGANLTLATLHSIENNSKYSDLTVAATACCGGIYNLVDFQNWMVQQPRYEQPLFIVYMLEAFSKFENLNIDYSLVFSDAFAPSIQGIIDGTKTSEQINSSFGTYHVGELFNDDFEDTLIFNNELQYAQLYQILEKNSIPVWNLKSDVTLHYGKNDIWAPGQLTLETYIKFRKEYPTERIKINAIDNVAHENSVLPMISEAMIRFSNY